jgi:hypothetical protein
MVYLVEGGHDYSGDDVLSIWSALELAEAEVARLEAIIEEHGDEAWDVDEDADCDYYRVRAMEVRTA